MSRSGPVTPFVVPVAERAWCHRLKEEKTSRLRKRDPRPRLFIAFDTEAATSATRTMPGFDHPHWDWRTQSLLFGTARIGTIKGSELKTLTEIIFYPDDLPEHGKTLLRKYFESRTKIGGRILREYVAKLQADGNEPVRHLVDDPTVEAQFMPLSRFLKEFYRIAYVKRALVIGFNLPFDLARLAWRWHASAHPRAIKGWSLTLWTYTDRKTGETEANTYRPRVIIKKAGPRRNFISFAGIKEGEVTRVYRGEFLDLGTLAFALTNSAFSLAGACKKFCGLLVDKDVEHGILTPDYIEYGRRDVKATVTLAGALLSILDRHPISRANGGNLSETKTYSPASLGKAYLDTVGFKAPIVPDDRLGACFAAFYGGWTEVAVRGRVPVTLLDFRKMYQTSFILQIVQSFIASERLSFIDDTETVRRFVATVTFDALFNKDTWPKLNVLCWVIPNGAWFQTTAKFDGQTPTSGMVPRYDKEPICYYLADVILAKLLSDRIPEIVKAERIVPRGKLKLQTATMPGNSTFNPATDNFFKFNVEHGEMMKRGIGPYTDLPKETRDELVPGIKGTGNGSAFGIYAETNEQDLPGGETEPVELWGETGKLAVRLAHPEDPGRFCCPPLAGLITAGARLLLGMAHREVMNRGGSVAFGDTDSLAVVAIPDGGTVVVDTRSTGSPLEIILDGQKTVHQRIKALSHDEVDQIIARFETLNPYDPDLLGGSILEIKKCQAYALCISSKRYCLQKADGTFEDPADRKESILGMMLSPLDTAPGDDRQDSSKDWISAAWLVVAEYWDTGQWPGAEWLSRPMVRRLANSTPEINWKNLRALNADASGNPLPFEEQVRPFNFLIAAQAVCGRETRALVAAFERNPAKWRDLDWVDAKTGERFALGPDAEGGIWRLKTVKDALQQYVEHYSPEWLDHTGRQAGRFTRGLMRRMPIIGGEKLLRTKESLTLSDDPENPFTRLPTLEYQRPETKGGDHPWLTIVSAIRAIGATSIAREMKVSRDSVERWFEGKCKPRNTTMEKLANVVVILAWRSALFTAREFDGKRNNFNSATALPLIPQRVEFLRINVWLFVNRLADIYGGMRGLARAMKIAFSTVQEWSDPRALSRDLETLNAIVERLAMFCRAEAVAKGRPKSPEPGSPGENRRVVLWFLLFSEDHETDDRIGCPTGDNLFSGLEIAGIQPDASFFESLNDGLPHPWPAQLLPNISQSYDR